MMRLFTRLIAIGFFVYSIALLPNLLFSLFWLGVGVLWFWYHERKPSNVF